MRKRTPVLCGVIALILIVGVFSSACGGKEETNSTISENATSTKPAESTGDDVGANGAGTPEQTGPDAVAGVGNRGDYEEDNTSTAPGVVAGIGNRGDYEEDNPPEQTDPVGTKPEDTKPEDTKPKPTESTEPATAEKLDPDAVTLDMFNAMSDAEQDAFLDQFPTLRDRIMWFNAQSAKEPTNETITSGDGNVDLGELIKP